jgi:hypothetical protein
MDSVFDSFLSSSVFDQFAKPSSVFDQFLEQKVTAPPAPTIHDKLRAQLERSKAHAENTRQNTTAARLPQGLRLGFN